jgi:uncharacterized surface protein with fasciclin (FAS1) repeats
MRTNILLPITIALFAFGCAEDSSDNDGNNDATDEQTDDTMDDGDLVEVAEGAGDFTTLLAAIEAAGLTDTLKTGGPFTVFAPTDAAFDALPEGTVESLLQDIPALTDILLYHVVDGQVGSAEVVDLSLVTTLQGSDFKISVDGDVFVNEAMVTAVDVPASNGVIHVLDSVILPPATIAGIVADDPNFSTLLAAVDAAGLVETLDGDGPFTVFAPTNDAFNDLPPGTVDDLLQDIPALTDILLYHVAADRLPAADVVAADAITTLGGEAEVVVDAMGVTIAGAQISVTDIPAGNGVIHVIDAVMLP